MTQWTKKWDGAMMEITATCADGRFVELHAMCSKDDVWCTFGYITVDGDEDNLVAYRADNMSAKEVGDLVARFEKEFA